MDLDEEVELEKSVKNMVENDKKSKPIVIVAIILVIIIIFARKINVKNSNIEYVEDLNNLPDPIQTATTGSEIKIVDNTEVKIEYVMNYTIQGKVVSSYTPIKYDVQSILIPLDIGMAWGLAGNDDAEGKVEYDNKPGVSGSRYLESKIKDSNWLKNIGGEEYFYTHISNNHLIPKNSDIEEKLKLIKDGDYLKITGYLVNLSWYEDGRPINIKGSTSRTDNYLNPLKGDNGGGSCEDILVTDVKWLEQK